MPRRGPSVRFNSASPARDRADRRWRVLVNDPEASGLGGVPAMYDFRVKTLHLFLRAARFLGSHPRRRRRPRSDLHQPESTSDRE